MPLISLLSGQELDEHAAEIVAELKSAGINPTTSVLLLINVVLFMTKEIFMFLQGNLFDYAD